MQTPPGILLHYIDNDLIRGKIQKRDEKRNVSATTRNKNKKPKPNPSKKKKKKTKQNKTQTRTATKKIAIMMAHISKRKQ